MNRDRHYWILTAVACLACLAWPAATVRAQGYGGPLTVQGLHQQHNPSAASRAFGGVTIGAGGDLGLMFAHPAALHGVQGLQVSVAGYHRTRDLRQEQHYAPVRYYPNLSLLLENRTDAIPDPDPELVGFTPADSVQRPYDDLSPNWSRDRTDSRPLHVLLAVPFSLGGLRLAAGLGTIQYANLDHYYQNNNVLDPAVLAQRPLPTLRPTDDNPVTVDWYQAIRSRQGTIDGYGGALAAHLPRLNLSLGAGALRLRGESDDFEQRRERGRLTFLANEFRADSSGGQVTRMGTSRFSATEWSFSAELSGRYASLGITLHPPTAFTREYTQAVEADTAGSFHTWTVDGEDRFRLPWRGTVGVSLRPREQLRVGFEYVFRPYARATYTPAAGEATTPWLSARLFRFGIAYEPADWLVFRGGMRSEADVFEPEGSALVGEPVTYRVFSVGFGLSFRGIRWDVTYEGGRMKYEDIWGSALSKNTDVRHVLATNLSFTLPVSR
ncbi:hypothetical protein [Rhodocaloribacter litoris]|uniref:hypothetical protein n=1 Tax=Rhodocaloribacter litoris TaxID=2558931 RepID=UPI001E46663F|nr:hypothetical protein [Rhodocaloribacter litoris]